MQPHQRDLRPGDVVKLKSGGPLMTVIAGPSLDPLCMWFGDDGVPLTHEFPSVALIVVEM